MEPNCYGCHSLGARHSMLREMGLNGERLLLAYLLQGTKRNKLIENLPWFGHFQQTMYEERFTNFRCQRYQVDFKMACSSYCKNSSRSYIHLVVIQNSSCQQFLYPNRLRDSLTKCLLRCFRDYGFKFCRSVTFFQASFTLFFFDVYGGDFLFIPLPTGYTSDPFPKSKTTKSYAPASFHEHKENSKWPFLSGFTAQSEWLGIGLLLSKGCTLGLLLSSTVI